MSRLIYVENDYDGRYGQFWGELGEVIRDRSVFLARPQDFDLVGFTGGEDVSPELYGHRNLGSHNSERRDAEEQEVYEIASDILNIPMTGICRGSQFLNVQMGGTMVQNLKQSHGGGQHNMVSSDGETFEVTSSHHQMSVLDEDGILLGRSELSVPWTDCAYDGDFPEGAHGQVDESHLNPLSARIFMTEAFAYPDANIFAVQHHPEWQDINCEAAQWTLNMIRKFCFEEKISSET
jgi:gamma-glutamyl-gamma-aminobutyrate hydrolase PuuD